MLGRWLAFVNSVPCQWSLSLCSEISHNIRYAPQSRQCEGRCSALPIIRCLSFQSRPYCSHFKTGSPPRLRLKARAVAGNPPTDQFPRGRYTLVYRSSRAPFRLWAQSPVLWSRFNHRFIVETKYPPKSSVLIPEFKTGARTHKPEEKREPPLVVVWGSPFSSSGMCYLNAFGRTDKVCRTFRCAESEIAVSESARTYRRFINWRA